MDQGDDKNFNIRDQEAERRARLGEITQKKSPPSAESSSFIKHARLALPLLALIMIAIVFTWGAINNPSFTPVSDPEKAPKTIGKNELLNPQFKSVDQKNQPYTITARRAFQAEKNESLMLLEEPAGDLLLNSGKKITVRSQNGEFEQVDQALFLIGDVRLIHDDGYQMETQELHVDLTENRAWTQKDVFAHGPEGTIESKGLTGDNNKQNLIFTGPAKLVLKRTVSTKNTGESP